MKPLYGVTGDKGEGDVGGGGAGVTSQCGGITRGWQMW